MPIVVLWLLVAIFPETPRAQLPTPPPPADVKEQPQGTGVIQGALQAYTPLFGKVTLLDVTPPWATRPWQITLQLTDERGFMLLAILAGALGSYLHAAQSFATYVENREAVRSWVWWYVLRAPIGASLGLLFYFVIRAGLISLNTGAVSPYGVVALGALAGWFSKQATDKLAEVFDTVFRTDKPVVRTDKPAEHGEAAREATAVAITNVSPRSLSAADDRLTVTGRGFAPGAFVTIGRNRLAAEFRDPTTVVVRIPPAYRPAAGRTEEVSVVNAETGSVQPAGIPVTFE